MFSSLGCKCPSLFAGVSHFQISSLNYRRCGREAQAFIYHEYLLNYCGQQAIVMGCPDANQVTLTWDGNKSYLIEDKYSSGMR